MTIRIEITDQDDTEYTYTLLDTTKEEINSALAFAEKLLDARDHRHKSTPPETIGCPSCRHRMSKSECERVITWDGCYQCSKCMMYFKPEHANPVPYCEKHHTYYQGGACPLCQESAATEKAVAEIRRVNGTQECCGADDWGLTSNDMCKDCPKWYTFDGRNSADKHTSQINDLESVVLSQGKVIGDLQALIEKQNAILDDAAASIQSLCAIAEAHQERLDLQVACLEVVANLLKARR